MKKERLLDLTTKNDRQQIYEEVVYSTIRLLVTRRLKRQGFDTTHRETKEAVNTESRRIAKRIMESGVDIHDKEELRKFLETYPF